MNLEITPAVTIKLLGRLWNHLSRRRQIQLCFLIGLILVSTFAEVISLAAVLPFLSIIIEPDRLFGNPIIRDMTQAWGITSSDQLVLPLTITFIILALMAAAIRILLMWASTQIAFTIGAELSIEVYRRTLYQPYRVHLARNSSEVISGIINKVNGVVGMLMSLLTLISATVLFVAIMLALLAINLMVAAVVAIVFGASYVLITLISRRRLYHNSQRIAFEQTQVVKALQEGLGGIRDVLLDGTQLAYCDIYRKADHTLRQTQCNNVVISQAPRYIMETLGIVLISALAYALSRQGGGIGSALPVLGALALGAQRLLPALQQIYSSWASIAGSHASLAEAIALLDQPLPVGVSQPASALLPFQNSILLNAVRFRYSSDDPWVLNGLNLTIPKGARMGFIGSTGSGKSTLLDLLMGLLLPTEGEILVDGQPITGIHVRAWQSLIAHVPQNIFLADVTLAENIAFGIPSSLIDMDRVKQSARQAQIADFIESRPESYDAFVGEGGIRLSGGQRQRIGIARALYKKARVLVFDEATSALDNETEKSVMEAIEGLGQDLTILLIAHRLTTLKNCTQIVELSNGHIVRTGTYSDLVDKTV